MGTQPAWFYQPIPKQKMKSTSPSGCRLIFRNISGGFWLIYHYVVEKLWRMPKNYSLGRNRSVSVKKQSGDLFVTIAEDGSDTKTVSFPSRRWAQFMESMAVIDEAVNNMIAKQEIQFKLHIGGKWHISVTTGFACVDIREYYYHPVKGPSPSKTGIALRIPEWSALKTIIQQLHQKHPTLSTAETCSRQLDHQNLQGALACQECNPFFENLFHLTPM